MTSEEQQLRSLKHRRIRRAKRLLRPLPRRATIHRYPVLKWFKNTARARSYLWSFRKQEVVPAFYIGCILSLMPVYGIQVPLAFALALLFRTNLMIMVAVQFITNPITAAPLYYATYLIGDFFLQIFYNAPNLLQYTALEQNSGHSLYLAIKSIISEHNEGAALWILHLFNSLILGGAILGYFIGFAFSFSYQYIGHRAAEELAILQGRADRIAKVRKSNEEAARSGLFHNPLRHKPEEVPKNETTGTSPPPASDNPDSP